MKDTRCQPMAHLQLRQLPAGIGVYGGGEEVFPRWKAAHQCFQELLTEKSVPLTLSLLFFLCVFVQWYKSRKIHESVPKHFMPRLSLNHSHCEMPCLTFHAAFLFPTVVCIVAWALLASLTVQEQCNFPTSHCIEIKLPPLIPMLGALIYSSFKMSQF